MVNALIVGATLTWLITNSQARKDYNAPDANTTGSNTMMDEEIVFINYNPARCGCVVEYSDGHGEYSDVITVRPCPEHKRKDAVK